MLVKDLMEALGKMPPDAQLVYHDARTLAGIVSVRFDDNGPMRSTVLLLSTNHYLLEGTHADV